MFRSKVGVNTPAALTGNVVLRDNSFAVQRLNPNLVDRTVQVIPQGRGRAFLVANTGTVSGFDLLVTDKDSAAILTIGAGDAAFIVGTGTGLVGIAIAGGAALGEFILDVRAATGLTIAVGTAVMTQTLHSIDTEAAAASDDLDTITGGAEGDFLILFPASAARTVVIKHAAGADRFFCPNAADISLAESTDYILALRNATQWVVLSKSTLASLFTAQHQMIRANASSQEEAILINANELVGRAASGVLQGQALAVQQVIHRAAADMVATTIAANEVFGRETGGNLGSKTGATMEAWVRGALAGLTADPSFNSRNLTGIANLTMTGDLRVQGSRVFVDAENVQLRQNYSVFNADYVTDAAQSGGIVVNYDPTVTTTTVAAGGFVAGVDAVSNPTVEVAATAGFAAADIILISGSTTNDGVYEVDALLAAPARLRIRGVGTVAAVELFTGTQFTAEVGAGNVYKTNVTVIRTGTDGLWEVGRGAVTPVTFGDLFFVGGTDVPVADGGTGSSTAGGARTNLGLVIGTDVQAFDATLLSLAALGTVADRVAYTTALDTWAETPLTAAGRALIDDASAAAQRTTLGLVIGTDVQAFDATLLSLAALGTVADRIAYTTALDTWAETALTAAGRAIIDDASAAAQRTTLGLVIGTDVQAFDATLLSLAALGTVADRIAYTTALDTWAETALTAAGRALIDDASAATQRTTLGLVIGTDVQAFDATLLSIAALGTVADRIAYTTALDVWAEATFTAAGRALVDDASAAAQRVTLGLLSDVFKSWGPQEMTISEGTAARASVGAGADIVDVMDFPDAATQSVVLTFEIPATAITVRIDWTSGTTVNNVVFAAALKSSGDFSAAFPADITATVAAPGVANNLGTQAAIALAGLTVGQPAKLRVRRLGGDAADTHAATARILQISVDG